MHDQRQKLTTWLKEARDANQYAVLRFYKLIIGDGIYVYDYHEDNIKRVGYTKQTKLNVDYLMLII